ncbi:MAG: mycothiol system anti-sigma-R factor [Mycobacterium sp.]
MTEHSQDCGTPDPAGPVADCSEVMAEVWTLLDGECTAATKAKLRRHLEACPGCLRHYGVEERIKTLIARKCSGDKAPQQLYERVRLEISHTTIVHRDR